MNEWTSERMMAPKRNNIRNWKTVTNASICCFALTDCSMCVHNVYDVFIYIFFLVFAHPHPHLSMCLQCVFEAVCVNWTATTTSHSEIIQLLIQVFIYSSEWVRTTNSDNKNHKKEIKRQTYGCTHNILI